MHNKTQNRQKRSTKFIVLEFAIVFDYFGQTIYTPPGNALFFQEVSVNLIEILDGWVVPQREWNIRVITVNKT